jgi:hypothetical protein
MEGLNKGVAPAYNVFCLVLRFEANNSAKSFELIIDDSGNRRWLPGKAVAGKYNFAIPASAAKGDY